MIESSNKLKRTSKACKLKGTKIHWTCTVVCSKRIGNVAKVTRANFILGSRLLASAHLVCLGLSVSWSCRWATPSTFAGVKCHTSAHICAPFTVQLRSTQFLQWSGFVCVLQSTLSFWLQLIVAAHSPSYHRPCNIHFDLPSHWSSQLTPSWRTLIKFKESGQDRSHDLLDLGCATGEVRWISTTSFCSRSAVRSDSNVLVLPAARTCVRSGCWNDAELPITDENPWIIEISTHLARNCWSQLGRPGGGNDVRSLFAGKINYSAR